MPSGTYKNLFIEEAKRRRTLIFFSTQRVVTNNHKKNPLHFTFLSRSLTLCKISALIEQFVYIILSNCKIFLIVLPFFSEVDHTIYIKSKMNSHKHNCFLHKFLFFFNRILFK